MNAPMQAEVAVRTNLKRRDIVVGLIATMFASPQQRWYLAILSLVCAYFISDTLVGFILGAIFLALVGWLGGAIFALFTAFFNPRIERGNLGEHSFVLGNEGLLEETEFNRTLHKWGALDCVTIIFGMVLVRAGGSTWHVIPLRSFASPEEARTFISALRQRTGAAPNS